MPPKFLGVAAGFSFCTHVDNISSTGRYQQKRNRCTEVQVSVVVTRKLHHNLRAKVGLFLTRIDRETGHMWVKSYASERFSQSLIMNFC